MRCYRNMLKSDSSLNMCKSLSKQCDPKLFHRNPRTHSNLGKEQYALSRHRLDVVLFPPMSTHRKTSEQVTGSFIGPVTGIRYLIFVLFTTFYRPKEKSLNG